MLNLHGLGGETVTVGFKDHNSDDEDDDFEIKVNTRDGFRHPCDRKRANCIVALAAVSLVEMDVLSWRLATGRRLRREARSRLRDRTLRRSVSAMRATRSRGTNTNTNTNTAAVNYSLLIVSSSVLDVS